MKISTKIKGENWTLLDQLRSNGIDAKMVRGGIVIDLPENNSGEGFIIPPEAKTSTLLIEAEEGGGGMTNTGDATIVCGLSGKKLRPYFVPRSGPLSNASHAYFAIPEAVVTIRVTEHHGIDATIKEHRIVREDNIAQIKTKILWNGRISKNLREVPNAFHQFLPAIEAGWNKIKDYHCRNVYYAEV